MKHNWKDFYFNDNKEYELKEVENFTYLVSSLYKNIILDREISIPPLLWSSYKSSVENRHLSIKTKVRIYEACVLSIHLSEIWPSYRNQEVKLVKHTRSLRFMLGKIWEDKITNEDVYHH